MTAIHPKSLYYDILEHEVQFARAVAYKAMRRKPFSVWEVLIPIVFILGYMRSRNNREQFVQNFIFTKKMALRGVRDMYAKDLSEADAYCRLETETKKLLDTVDNKIYSEAIRQAQLSEMAVLMTHYDLLFKSGPGNYAARIVSAYKDATAYLNFTQRLNQREKAVAVAAIQTLGADADKELMTRIETSADTLRRHNARKYFSHAD